MAVSPTKVISKTIPIKTTIFIRRLLIAQPLKFVVYVETSFLQVLNVFALESCSPYILDHVAEVKIEMSRDVNGFNSARVTCVV